MSFLNNEPPRRSITSDLACGLKRFANCENQRRGTSSLNSQIPERRMANQGGDSINCRLDQSCDVIALLRQIENESHQARRFTIKQR
jgi:hypothetical protein